MASPPQGFVVILPGEITQADLDPSQPPAKLSAYPLVAGKDVQPYPEKQLVNDNSGNIATIIGSDSSTVTIPLSKLAALVASFNGRTGAVSPANGDYTQSQITHENGSVDEAELANDNTGTIASIIGADTSSVVIPLSKLAALVSSFASRTGNVVPEAGDYVKAVHGSVAQNGGSITCYSGPNSICLVLSDVASSLSTGENYWVLGSWVVVFTSSSNFQFDITNGVSGTGTNDIVAIGI